MSTRRADDNTYTLLSNASATGSSVTVRGGEYLFTVEGTATGATIALQVQTPNGTWSTVSIFNNSAVSSSSLPYAQTSVDLPAGAVRALVSGGSPSALYSYLVGLG
jgi:hypothetical protein